MLNKIRLSNSDPKLRKSYIQMIFSLIIKFISMGVSFISVPVILNFVSYENYGIYLALTSSFALINILDIGLGDGLRNKFAEAKTKGDLHLAKTYVSTTYIVNFFLSILIIFIYFIYENHITWSNILNISPNRNNEIKLIARILIIATALQFFLQAFLNILKGDQKYITYSIIGFILNLFSILTIFILISFGYKGSLYYLALAFFVVPNISLLIINFSYFLKFYREVSPSFKYVKLNIVKSLSLLSFKFFVINIMSVISLQSINLIVIRNFKPSAVVDFNLLFKYYFLLISIAFIIFNPIWSTFTESIVKGDVEWTKNLLKKSLKSSMLLTLIVPIMIFIANPFISLWSGTTFNSSFSTNILFGTWVILVVLSEPYKMMIKGSGQLDMYLIYSIVFTAIQILLSIILIKYFNQNSNGILLACIVTQLMFLLFFYNKTVNILLKIQL